MTLEERLYEAYQLNRGIRLSAAEVEDLMHTDNAMRTRITNAIAVCDLGWDLIATPDPLPLKLFREQLRKELES